VGRDLDAPVAGVENVAGAVKIPFESGMSQRNVPASSAVGLSTLAARS
jgi:hypothetical protein